MTDHEFGKPTGARSNRKRFDLGHAFVGTVFVATLWVYVDYRVFFAWWMIGVLVETAHRSASEEPLSEPLRLHFINVIAWVTLWPYCLFVNYLLPLIRRK